jgi:hypothetical protein
MSGFVRLGVLFVLGAALGIWTFIEPWMIHYPLGARNQWTPSIWSNVWVGAIVTAASLAGLVLVVAVGLRSAVRSQATSASATPQEDGSGL